MIMVEKMNEVLKTIDNLRSIHGNFSDKNVTENDLNAILKASVRAANAGNMQTYSIIVVNDKAVMKELCQYVGSVALIFCVDHTRIVNAAKHFEHPFTPKTISWFITGSTDAILAAQTAAIAARSLGIDSLFTSSIFRGDFDRIYKLINIPKIYCFPLISVILGYPKREPPFKKDRIFEPGVIHRGKYKEMTSEELKNMIDDYADPSKHLSIAKDLKKMLSFWGDGRDDENSKQLFSALVKSGYLDNENMETM
jgi:nitroreductase